MTKEFDSKKYGGKKVENILVGFTSKDVLHENVRAEIEVGVKQKKEERIDKKPIKKSNEERK